jgi:type I restriction enzyme, S subunit
MADTIPLRDICVLITKGTTPTTVGGRFAEAGINFIKSESLSYDGAIDEAKFAFIDFATHQKLARSQIAEGDVLYSIAGVNLGKCGLARAHILPANTNQAVAIIRVDATQGCREFISYFLRNKCFVQMVLGGVAQSAQPNVNLAEIGRFRVPNWPLAKQRAIASILGVLDDKIDLNRHMNETLEAMARAIFKDWFVDFSPTRAKMQGRAAYLAPEIWALFPDRLDEEGKPKGWDFAKLGSLCVRVAMGPFGSDITTDNFVDHGVPVVRGGNLKNGFIDDRFAYVTDAKADALRNANAFAQDIVITHRGTLGQVGIIPKKPAYKRYVVSQSQMLLTAHPERATPRFIFEFLRSEHGTQQLLAFTSQVGVPAIARPTTSLKSLNVLVPSQQILFVFDKILAPLVDREDINIMETRSLVATRDLLLPKLMSDEIRVKDAENFAAAVA